MPPRLAALLFTAVLIAIATCSGCGPKPADGAGGQMGGGGSPSGGSGGAEPAVDASADLTGSGGSSGAGDAMTMADATAERTDDAAMIADATAERDIVKRNFCGDHPFEGGPIPNVTADVFCAKSDTACKFGSAGGYATMADCLARYGGETATIQGCRAGVVCDAAFFSIQLGVSLGGVEDYCKRKLATCQ